MSVGNGTRFNRYIVECKANAYEFSVAVPSDLIDTLWNVKYIMMPQVPSQSFSGFNRYIVECKERYDDMYEQFAKI